MQGASTVTLATAQEDLSCTDLEYGAVRSEQPEIRSVRSVEKGLLRTAFLFRNPLLMLHTLALIASLLKCRSKRFLNPPFQRNRRATLPVARARGAPVTDPS